MTHDENPTTAGPECFHLGGRLRTELLAHLPFSASSVILGILLAGLICFLAPVESVEGGSHDHAAAHPGESGHGGEFHGGFIELFHLFHPAHMLFSAAATTAMFRRYDKRVGMAILVGFTGAVAVCGLSDVVFPHLSLLLMGKSVGEWHVCIAQHPGVVLPFAFVGVALGWIAANSIERTTYYSHSLHVFVSTMATIFYLVGPLGRLEWIDDVGQVFFFTLVSVMLPCCFSDILYPLLLTRRGREAYAHSGHSHTHGDGHAHH